MAFPTSLTIAEWFKRAKPKPTERDIRTQIGVHFEEVAEMLVELDGFDLVTRHALLNAYEAVHNLAEHLKNTDIVELRVKNHVALLDALCDQQVTAIGVGTFLQYKMGPALDMVNRSNWSKFDDNGDPILAPNGKIMKGPDYFKPDLVPFIIE